MRKLLSFAVLAVLLSSCSHVVPVPKMPMMKRALKPDEAWKQVLTKFVDAEGRVDFKKLRQNPEELAVYVNWISTTSPDSKPDDFPDRMSRLAYYVNSYNALALFNYVEADVMPKAVDSMPKRAKFFYFRKFLVGGVEMSLYDYVNEVIRKENDEKVHFALTNLCVGAPKLLKVPYTAKTIDEMLEQQTVDFLSSDRHLKIDDYDRVVYFSEILKFFREDFLAKAGSLIEYTNRFRRDTIPATYKIDFLPYDWTINAVPEPVASDEPKL